MSTNIGDTLRRLRFNGLTIPLFAPSDGDFLLGDADNGAVVPQGETVSIHQHADSVSDGLSLTVHNVTRGTSATVDFNAETYDNQEVEVYFGQGDELAIEVSGTTDAADGYLLVEHETGSKPLGVGDN